MTAVGFDRRELVREQEVPAPVQQRQAAPLASRPVPLGPRDQRFDLDESAAVVGRRQRVQH